MWNPQRNKEKEANQLLIYYASKGLEKELKNIKKRIERASDALKVAHDTNSTIKKRSRIRTELDSYCEQRDRLELALEMCKGGFNE